jgi:YD repeat-containing protein
MRIERYKQGRHWAVYDDAGKLVVVTVYKRGAEEVRRRLTLIQESEEAADTSAASSSFASILRERPEGKEGSYGR